MGIGVSTFDFAPYVQTVINKGVSAADAQMYLNDLKIILHAAEDTKRRHALTKGADLILHELLEDAEGCQRLSGLIFGPGRSLVHNSTSFMTPEFDRAWDSTREVFAAENVVLLADYRSDNSGGYRSAGACFLESGPFNSDATLDIKAA